MNRHDEENLKQAFEPIGGIAGQGMATEPVPVQRNLLGRLYDRRRQLTHELQRVNNSIEFCERNQALVEVVEVVLASREKCDRPY